MLCSECKFYQPLETWQRPYLPVNERFGECRRNPPVTSCKPEDRDHQYQALFPTVRTNDWCGDFAPRMPRAGQRREDGANAAFDAASREDATAANVGAVAGQCQSGGDQVPKWQKSKSPAATLGTPGPMKRSRGPREQRR